MTKQETYIKWILSHLNKGEVSFNRVFELNLTKYNLARPTFSKYWKLAQERHKETMHSVQKEVEATTIQQAKENALNGLKSKSERLMILQKQVDETLRELDNGTTEDTITLSGSVKKVTRKMTINEVTLLRRTLHLLQSEISKIEGDYAAVKQEIDATVQKIKVIRE